MNVLRVGVIGVGHLGKVHTRLWKEIGGVNVAGVFDVNEKEAAKVAREYETKTFPSLKTLLDEVDAVSIVTPTFAHYETARLALDKGKHAFIEKPITTTTSEAADLIRRAERNDTGRAHRAFQSCAACDRTVYREAAFF